MDTLSALYNRRVQNVLFLLFFFLSSPTHISVYTYIHVIFFFFLKCTMAPSGIVWNISYKYFF